jgi:hypothetical protein
MGIDTVEKFEKTIEMLTLTGASAASLAGFALTSYELLMNQASGDVSSMRLGIGIAAMAIGALASAQLYVDHQSRPRHRNEVSVRSPR